MEIITIDKQNLNICNNINNKHKISLFYNIKFIFINKY